MGVGFVKDVLFNAGEGLSETDLNNAQRFLLFMLGDGAFGCAAPQLAITDQPGMSTAHLYAFGNSGAPYEDGSGTRTPNFLRGLIAQRIVGTAPDGTDSQVLFYFLDADEASVARPAVVTNPRWDVVSVAMTRVNADSQSRDFEDASTRALTTSSFSKQRRTVCTITWTTGAESVTPVEPSIPVGDVKLAAFQIRPAVTAFDPTQDIRDYRMPIGASRIYNVDGWRYPRDETGAAEWADTAFSGVTGNVATGATTQATCLLPVMGGSHRILAVGFTSEDGAGGTLAVTLSRVNDLSPTHTSIRTLTSLLDAGGGGASYGEFDILTNHGAPLWSNGYSAGYAVDRSQEGTISASCLGLVATPTGATFFDLRGVRWKVA